MEVRHLDTSGMEEDELRAKVREQEIKLAYLLWTVSEHQIAHEIAREAYEYAKTSASKAENEVFLMSEFMKKMGLVGWYLKWARMRSRLT